MPKKSVDKDSGITRNANDADTSRTVDIPNAEAVQKGELSASQMGDGNIAGTDVQWPPGRIESAGRVLPLPGEVQGDVVERSAGVAVIPTEGS